MAYARGTIGFELEAATRILQKAGVETAIRDAQLLVAHFFGMEVGLLRMRLEMPVPHKYTEFGAQSYKYDILTARGRGRPVSKIIGKKAFWNAEFRVSDDVLDPRPDTERLIEVALEHPFDRVLDLGTGSGCILISLLQEQRQATGLGVDISERALKLAQLNSQDAGTQDVAFWRVSDWFENVEGQFDLIVSNPPYIALDEMADLSKDVRDFDPHVALTDGGDGLSCYRKICAQVKGFLRPKGRLIVEIGPTQATAVSQMFKDAGLEYVQVFQDLDGRDRVISGNAG